MDKQAIADITFRAWCKAEGRKDWYHASIYEKHLDTLGYIPLSNVEDQYTLWQGRNPILPTLADRYHQAARKLRWFTGTNLNMERQLRHQGSMLQSVSSLMTHQGNKVALEWIEDELPIQQMLYPSTHKMLTRIQTHLQQHANS